MLKNKKSGFTLIELIIVIVLLGVISIAGVNIISPIFKGYIHSKTTDLLFSEAQFVVGRIAKELRNSIPNSINYANISTESSNSGIQFCIFDYTGYYSDNISGDNHMIVDTTAITELNTNDKISIYNTKNEYLYLEQRVYIIQSKDTANQSITFNKSIEEDSPYYRYFRIKTPITYYKNGNILYRAFNYELNDSNSGTNPSSTNNITNIVTKNLESITFEYYPVELQRNAMVTIRLTLKKNDTIVSYAENVHIRNLP